MKTALVHDWLIGIGGGEKVVQAIAELYPSPIYTLIEDKEKLRGTFFEKSEIFSSFLQKLPGGKHYFRNFLPLFPFAIEQFDLSGYELILSSSHAVAKGVLTHPGQLHICYCHTPMRYAWDLYHHYLSGLSGVRKMAAKWSLHYLRNWDVASASRVDHFLVNSAYVGRRIQKLYRRESTVIHPPVSTHLFEMSSEKENYYITISRLVPYKRIDLIVEAFSAMTGKTLLVVGDGPELKKMRAKAAKNVHFLGHLSDEPLRAYLAKAKAFIFAAEEDFGIVNVEAQASGIPVIAYGKGGALETVIKGKTGLFFDEQSPGSLMAAVQLFETMQDRFDPHFIKAHAETFNEARFKQQFKSFVDGLRS